MAVFSLFAVLSVYALTLANRFASTSRYETLALAAAQQRLDLIATTPWSILRTTPTVLAAGTTVENAPSVTLPLNNDPFNAATGLSSAFTNYDTQVLDSRTTVITSLNSRAIRADVTVTYTYRTKQHNITLTSIRVSDDF